MRSQSGNAGNGPVQFDQLRYNLSVLLDQDASADTEIAIPPCAVQRSSVRRHAELDIACLRPQVGNRLQLRREGVDVSCYNRGAITGHVVVAHGESNERRTVAVEVVLSTLLQFPVVTLRQLLVSSLFQILCNGVYSVEDGRVGSHKIGERLRVLLRVLLLAHLFFSLEDRYFGDLRRNRWRALMLLWLVVFIVEINQVGRVRRGNAVPVAVTRTRRSAREAIDWEFSWIRM